MKTDYGTLYIHTYIHTYILKVLIHNVYSISHCAALCIFYIFNINSLSEINAIYADPSPPKAGDI